MAINERIRFFRNLRGMTLRHLGMQIGYPDKNADVRIAQYERGSRKPRADTVHALAEVLDVSADALNIPNIDSYTGVVHTLFVLEDCYGLYIDEVDGEVCLKVDPCTNEKATALQGVLLIWKEQAKKLRSDEISKEEYDQWRYHYSADNA